MIESQVQSYREEEEMRKQQAEELSSMIRGFKIKEFDKELKSKKCYIKDGDNCSKWITINVNEKGEISSVNINTGLLAEYIEKTVYYIFLRESAVEGTLRFVYNGSVYKQFSDYDFKSFIKKYIPTKYMRIKDVNETMQFLYSTNKYFKYSEINPERYINFSNGLLDLKTWTMVKHNPMVLSTIQLPTKYNPSKETINNRAFDKYLDYLVDGDEEKKKLILQFMGVSLSNIHGHRMKKSLFLVGTHNTGKSKIKELLIKLLGEENANTLDLETLEARFGSSNVFNKRLIGSNDMSFLKVKELKTFKLLTGGDTVFMETKGENGFNAKFNGIAWFCCNELPKFGGDKGAGVYERFAIVKCNNIPVPKEKQNKMLLDDMYEEKDYIVNLALLALKEVIDNGYNYNIPSDSNRELERYKVDNDSFLSFFNECTIEREDKLLRDKCYKATIYKIYVEWCKDNNNGYHVTKKEMSESLERMKKDNTKLLAGKRYYSEFTITDEAKKDYSFVYGEFDGSINENALNSDEYAKALFSNSERKHKMQI